MAGGGGDAPPPPVDGREFLLQLLKKPPHRYNHHPPPPPPPPIQSQAQPPPPPPPALTDDPAVATVGATVPFPQHFSSNGLSPTPPLPPHLLHQSPPPPFAPHGFYLQNPNPNRSPILSAASPPGFNQGNFQQNIAQSKYNSPGEGVRKLGFMGTNANADSVHLQGTKDLSFGSLRVNNEGLVNGDLNENLMVSQEDKRNLGISVFNDKRRDVGLEGFGGVDKNGFDFQQSSSGRDHGGNSSVLRANGHQRSDSSRRGTGYWGRQGHNFNNHRAVVMPPGFSRQQMSGGSRDYPIRKESFDHIGDKGRHNFGESRYRSGQDEMERRFSSINGRNDGDGDRGLSGQLDHPSPPGGSKLHSVSASDIEGSMMASHAKDDEASEEFGNGTRGWSKENGHGGHSDLDDLEEQHMESLGLEDESEERSDKKKHYRLRDKGYRSDKRGQRLIPQWMRQEKRQVLCRGDINRLNAPFVAIYESLIPAEEEKAKQKQLLLLLEQIVRKEWPEARLFLYGSCANSFGFSKSDIDVCLDIDDADVNKSDVLLKLADMLKLENLQNVQALTRARVPIVKLMDPATGISCDICINNVLAVVNTKLLQDYAQIDVRLRQLAFLVKHWAKSRVVNEPYQGTLSSYAYVLMCIHFLQHRRPAILPCLQEMKATYSETVDNVECSYYDRVENLVGFGSRNRESVAQLVWAFFNYWAYAHDYPNDVISVRRGTILSKQTKNWTRRIGNDRHLICIEDPFETFHDLGRVVDRRSIGVLREEFVRAAEILQSDPNPCVTLFEPYVPT